LRRRAGPQYRASLAEPALGLVREAHHREVRPDLDDGSSKNPVTFSSAMGWYGLSTAMRLTPSRSRAARHADAPVETSRPDSARTRSMKAALPATPPQNVSEDMPMIK
jgi:hypothetical protein